MRAPRGRRAADVASVCSLSPLLASVCPPPPGSKGARDGYHRLVAGSLFGGAAGSGSAWELAGKDGGCCGGGGIVEVPSCLRESRVKVCSVVLCWAENSQQGRTLCPEGALSSW